MQKEETAFLKMSFIKNHYIIHHKYTVQKIELLNYFQRLAIKFKIAITIA